jgi:gamma-glutamyltranspeptidase/glutathione hydrolase
MTTFGIVAASQTLAAQAGAQMLEHGGNAVDAAITANAVLGLVEPMSNGVGGDLFAIVYEAKTGKLYGLNASGWAASGLTIEFLQAKGSTKMPLSGPFTVTVPGAVSGWDLLRKRFGRKDFSALLAPAIYYAEHGFPVTERIAGSWSASKSALSRDAEAARAYLPGGRAPGVGELFRNANLAHTLRLIAEHGSDGFYKGPTADAIVDALHARGGTMTPDDLADFHAEWVEPISTTYHGWTVHELPPNGQGIAALEMLNIMKNFPLADYGPQSARALHVMIEAKKLAYADLLRYIGDPHFSKIPVHPLLSKELAARRAKLIDPAQAMAEAAPSDLTGLNDKSAGDTIYLTAVDQDGNIVSLIQSLYEGFGSGIVPAGGGFALQNRGALFTLAPNQPNSLAPRKRPLHTIIPAFMQKDDVRIGFGIMGGWNQSQAHAQFVANVVDFGMNIQAALDAPRFTKMTFGGRDVQMEPRIPLATRDQLTQWGHQIRVLPVPYSGVVGGGQAVQSDASGVHQGASSPRKDGEAVPQGPPFPASTGTVGTHRGTSRTPGR